MTRVNAILLCCSLLLYGCSTPEGEFPSLAKRPFETQTPPAEAVELPAPAIKILPADLQAKADAMMTRLDKAQSAYATALPSVRSIANAAAGSAIGSENWVNAQLQLSRLDKARADSVAVQGEFDALMADQNDAAAMGAASDVAALLAPYQTQIAHAVSTQSQEIDRLSKIIGE